jgi:hypothetical protein
LLCCGDFDAAIKEAGESHSCEKNYASEKLFDCFINNTVPIYYGCPNINELVDKQTKTQQICDNLEFQDKTKSEKLRLERNKQYLLKLQNQQEQIDQLNNVINNLETQRENRAQTSDKVRVLQYQKQAEDVSTVRDLANQRLNSQDNNQLYLDVKVNNIL